MTPAASSQCPRRDHKSPAISTLGQVTTSPAQLLVGWVMAAAWWVCLLSYIRHALIELTPLWSGDGMRLSIADPTLPPFFHNNGTLGNWNCRGPVMAQDEVNLGTVYLSSTIFRQIHQKRISVMSPLLLSPTCLSHWVAWATGHTRTFIVQRPKYHMSLWAPDPSIPSHCRSKTWLWLKTEKKVKS